MLNKEKGFLVLDKNDFELIMKKEISEYDELLSFLDFKFYNPIYIRKSVSKLDELISLDNTVLVYFSHDEYSITDLTKIKDINSYDELIKTMINYDPKDELTIFSFSLISVFINHWMNSNEKFPRRISFARNAFISSYNNIFDIINNGSIDIKELNYDELSSNYMYSDFVIQFCNNIDTIQELINFYSNKNDDKAILKIWNTIIRSFQCNNDRNISSKDIIYLIKNNEKFFIEKVGTWRLVDLNLEYEDYNYFLYLLNKDKNMKVYSQSIVNYIVSNFDKFDVNNINKVILKKSMILKDYYKLFEYECNDNKIMNMASIIHGSKSNILYNIQILPTFINTYTFEDFKKLDLSYLIDALNEKLVSKYSYEIALVDLTELISDETENLQYLCDLIVEKLPVLNSSVKSRVNLIKNNLSKNRNLFYFLNISLEKSNNKKIMKALLNYNL